MRKGSLVIVLVILLLFWQGLYSSDMELKIKSIEEHTSNATSLWFPPYPVAWNKVGILVSSRSGDRAFAYALGENLADALSEVFVEVQYLNTYTLIEEQEVRLDAVLHLWVEDVQIQGRLFRRKMEVNLTLESFEPLTGSITEEGHRYRWQGHVKGSKLGLKTQRMITKQVAERLSAAMLHSVNAHMNQRQGNVVATATAPFSFHSLRWFKRVPVVSSTELTSTLKTVLPQEYDIESLFKQEDLYGRTVSLVCSFDISEGHLVRELEGKMRTVFDQSNIQFVEVREGHWNVHFAEDAYGLEINIRHGILHLLEKRSGPLFDLNQTFYDFVLGKESRQSLIVEAEQFFHDAPQAVSRFFLANVRLEVLLDSWPRYDKEARLQALERVERLFRQSRLPLDGALHAYALGRLYFKIGVTWDHNYLVSAEQAFNASMDYGYSEVYPYALFGKALVISAPQYLGHDYVEAIGLFSELVNYDQLAVEAQTQLQRTNLLLASATQLMMEMQDDDPLLQSYLLMLQGDWEAIEELLLDTSHLSSADYWKRRLMYESLCRQTQRSLGDRYNEAKKDAPPAGYLAYLKTNLLEKYNGIYKR